MPDPVTPRQNPPIRSTIRPSASPASIDATTAVFTFVGSWVVAQIVSAIVLTVIGVEGRVADAPIGTISLALVAAWSVYLGGMWIASQRAGTGDPIADYGIQFRSVDLLGLGIGVLSQLVVINLVYLGLAEFWPDTFTEDRLEENARNLVDRADGATMLLLVLVVAVGAPVVEELFYRGLLQRSLTTRFNDVLVVVGVAAVFALVHFRPVEYPGLFVFGLILGTCALRTGRLGMPILAHVGFNATGLVLAAG
ncbi:MAG: CPBP family intramembrane glutamic endopeptidase [Ilumatobacteraceae bacterium]